MMRAKELTKLILFEDESYMALNKPSGISVLADRSGEPGLLALLKELKPTAQACHRIDKETSGVILFALNPDAYRSASIQFEKRRVGKVYHALVPGRADFRTHKEASPIYSSGTESMVRGDGKGSTTYFQTLEMFKAYTLLECKPETGRMHQIRVHLSHLGYPIIADALYGGEPFYVSSVKRRFNIGKYEEEKPLMGRLALHAQELSFFDQNDKEVVVKAPYPKDFSATLNQLRKNNN